MSGKEIKKAANCFIGNATFARSKGEPPAYNLAPAAQRAADGYQKKHGGLWVGGRVSLQADRIWFSPNALNSMVNQGFENPEVKLSDVTSVELEPGVLTKIVVVTSPNQSIKFRCFGAPKFAEAIRRAVAAAGGPSSPS